MCGVVGEDKDGVILKKTLSSKNVDVSLIIEDNSRQTTVKKRVVSGNNYQMIRLDYENTGDISENIKNRMIENVMNILSRIDAVVISDYAKGVITEKLARTLISESNKRNIPVIVDGKPNHLLFFKDCTLITPNLKEASEMSGIHQDLLKMGKRIMEILNTNIFITRGADGISVFDKKGNHTHIMPKRINKIFDVTGAGDTVIAVSTLALVSGFNLIDSARLANYAAGLVVQKPGTSVISLEELKNVQD